MLISNKRVIHLKFKTFVLVYKYIETWQTWTSVSLKLCFLPHHFLSKSSIVISRLDNETSEELCCSVDLMFFSSYRFINLKNIIWVKFVLVLSRFVTRIFHVCCFGLSLQSSLCFITHPWDDNFWEDRACFVDYINKVVVVLFHKLTLCDVECLLTLKKLFTQ